MDGVDSGHGEYHRTFTPRQIHIMSLGGQIGAGLFITTGLNLRNAGPGALLIGILQVCSCVFALHHTVSEMTIAFPVSGNFIDFADRFVDPAFSFSAGFSMWLGWTAIVAAEATFFAVVVNYWAQDSVHPAVWYTLFLLVMLGIFILPSKWFAWFEYFVAILKVMTLLIFMVVAFAIIFGAGPKGYVHHGETWQNGLAFLNGFKGYGTTVLILVSAIGDNTFTGFLAGETVSPRYSVGHAAFLVPIRVVVVYSLSAIFIGLLVSPVDERLFGGSGVAASPFTIAIDNAGIPGLPHLLNAVILFAVASIGAESIYVASRILRTMAFQGLIPKWVAKVDKKGRPANSLGVTSLLVLLLTYINLSANGTTVFNWIIQITVIGYFMVWVFIAITSFRFRAALKAQNDGLLSETHAWKSTFWPLPPLWLLLNCTFFLGSFGLLTKHQDVDTPSAYYFFQYMFGFILILVCGIGYKIIMRTKLRDLKEVDLQTGRRPLTVAEINMLDDYNALPRWRKFVTFVQLW
ncbi:amino acid permease [Thozetella sp. PMI_491]|nr:amino acid permease [Thozetella sp. PMI_491]